MQIIKKQISKEKLRQLAENTFGDLVKAVVDVKKNIMVIGGELHADEEALLLERGSKQENLWGINLYPKLLKKDWIEFDSMINLRPSQKNFTRSVDNEKTRNLIIKIINGLVK